MRKLEPIDISIISAHMGRFQTAIVALVVFAITVHAYITRNTTRSHAPLVIAVPDGTLGRACEPVTRLIARQTARPMETVHGWPVDAEVYLMPTAVFMRERDRLGLQALFGMGRTGGERAVVVARRGVEEPPRAARDVLVGPPGSLNGCWAQLRALAARGVRVPRADSLRVSPEGGREVVWAVAEGQAPYGACRHSEVHGDSTVTVVLEAPAVPDLIVAARGPDAGYVRARLGPLAGIVDGSRPDEADRDAVELAAERGLGTFRPVTPVQMKEIDALYAFMMARE